MTVLILQLLALLLAAASIGLFTGWQLCRQRAAAQLLASSAQSNHAYQQERERADTATALLEATTQELGNIKVDHKQASRRLGNLTGAIGDSEGTIAGLEADVAMLQETMHDMQASHQSDLQAVRLHADSQLEEADDHEAALAASTRQLTLLEAALSERDSALQSLQTLVDTGDASIDQLREQLAAAEQSVADRAEAARQAQLKHQVAEAAALETISRLEAEQEQLRPESASAQPDHAAMHQRLEKASISEQQVRAELSTAHKHLLELQDKYRELAARADSDDLKRIRGIGPVFETSLKEQGITQFNQIAAFTVEDIEIISVCLQTFPDRIRRDRWIEQAALLARNSRTG